MVQIASHFARIVTAGALLTITLMLTGCLRYVPARSELERARPVSSGTADNADIGGESEFKKHEQRMAARLTNLVKTRGNAMDIASGGGGAYRIGRGDVIGIDVFGFPDMSTEAEVTAAGTIEVPLLDGGVPAAGRTVSELRSDIAGRLANFIRNPQVRLTMRTFEASKVAVIGEVAKPGVYPLTRNGQLLTELLSMAGGRTEKGGGRIVLIPAGQSGSGSVMPVSAGNAAVAQGNFGVEIDMDDLIGSIDKPPLMIPVHAGDTIIIPEAGTFEVDGEVLKPGSYNLGAKTSILGAIAAAGGLTYSAKVDEVELIRDVGAGRKAAIAMDIEDIALRGRSDLRLRDGDIVRVPSEPGKFTRRQIVEAINGLFGVGVSGRVN